MILAAWFFGAWVGFGVIITVGFLIHAMLANRADRRKLERMRLLYERQGWSRPPTDFLGAEEYLHWVESLPTVSR